MAENERQRERQMKGKEHLQVCINQKYKKWKVRAHLYWSESESDVTSNLLHCFQAVYL